MLEARLGRPVTYLNDGNAGALWGHFTIFGADSRQTSISAVIGTGLGGGVIVDGNVVKGRMGFGGELGHVLIPYQGIAGIEGLQPKCNCGRTGDLESLCSLTAITKTLLPYFLVRYPGHDLARLDVNKAAKLVRGMAEKGDPLCRDIFRVQAHALGLFFDEMVNTFDPDALDRRRRRAGNRRGLPALVPRRNPRRHARPARGAGGDSDSRDAQRRYRRRPRRGHRSPQVRASGRPAIATGASGFNPSTAADTLRLRGPHGPRGSTRDSIASTVCRAPKASKTTGEFNSSIESSDRATASA